MTCQSNSSLHPYRFQQIINIMQKLPPIEKVFEAWTAIVDDRVSIWDNHATVTSSDDTKTYDIRFEDNKYSSTDNATYWRGYPGYPVLAVMMIRGLLPFNAEEADHWREVNWKSINVKYKNDYAAAVRHVAEERGIDLSVSYTEAERVLNALKELPIEIKRKL